MQAQGEYVVVFRAARTEEMSGGESWHGYVSYMLLGYEIYASSPLYSVEALEEFLDGTNYTKAAKRQMVGQARQIGLPEKKTGDDYAYLLELSEEVESTTAPHKLENDIPSFDLEVGGVDEISSEVRRAFAGVFADSSEKLLRGALFGECDLAVA